MIDTNIIITGIIAIVTASIGSFVTWILAKKKYNSEVDNTLIGNMQKSLEFYISLSNDTKARLDIAIEDNKETMKKNSLLEEEVAELKKQVCSLKDALLLFQNKTHAESQIIHKIKKNGTNGNQKV